MVTTNLFMDLYVTDLRYGRLQLDQAEAWHRGTCPYCHGEQSVVLAATREDAAPAVKWLRCVSCREGFVLRAGSIVPGVEPLRVPQGVAGNELAVWREVRACLASGANSAAVLLCRKLLLHMAVEHGLPAKNDKDRAPGFVECVDHLQAVGVMTSHMRPWVERVKDVGNEATHELVTISAPNALMVATFTEQLLVLAYEMDALMQGPPPTDESQA